MAISVPVPPDSVRVWRGYRLPSFGTVEQFFAALGGEFIPFTAQLQRLYGLTAYLPTVMPTLKPAGVPDEIALVFYRSQQDYNNTSNIVGGRAYQVLHKAVFSFPESQTGFPVALGKKLALNTPYYLFENEADWQSGFAQVYAGTRKKGTSEQKFTDALLAFLQDYRKHRPAGLDGAYVVVDPNGKWFLYWEHWTSEAASLHGRISELAGISEQLLLKPFEPAPVPPSLTAIYKGLDVAEGDCFNIQFPRTDVKP